MDEGARLRILELAVRLSDPRDAAQLDALRTDLATAEGMAAESEERYAETLSRAAGYLIRAESAEARAAEMEQRAERAEQVAQDTCGEQALADATAVYAASASLGELGAPLAENLPRRVRALVDRAAEMERERDGARVEADKCMIAIDASALAVCRAVESAAHIACVTFCEAVEQEIPRMGRDRDALRAQVAELREALGYLIDATDEADPRVDDVAASRSMKVALVAARALLREGA